MLNEHWPHWQIPDLHRYFVNQYRMQYFQEVQSVWLTSAGAMVGKLPRHKKDWRGEVLCQRDLYVGQRPMLRPILGSSKWDRVDCPTCLTRKPKPRKPPEFPATQDGVARAWAASKPCSASNMHTDGYRVWSFGHLIGNTDEQDQKVLLDCHASSSTAAHCSALHRVAQVHESCHKHPKSGQ